MAPPKKAAAAPVDEDLSDLKGLVQNAKQIEDKQRAQVAGNNSYIGIVPDPKSNILKPGKPEYIEGAEYGHFFIGSRSLALGEELEVTVLGVFKIYEESEVLPPGTKSIPRIFGYWLEEDAIQVPVGDNNFERPFVSKKDGQLHVLKIAHWIPVQIRGHENVVDALFSTRSKANQIAIDLEKVIKKNSEIAPQIRFKVTTQEIEHKEWNSSSLYPKFDLIGENFHVDEEGSISLIKGGMKAPQIRALVELYNKLQSEYDEAKMVSRKSNIAGLIGAPAESPKALPGKPGTKGYTKPAPEGDSPTF